MPFDVEVERHTQYVRYNAADQSSLKRFAGLIVGIAADIEQYEDDRILLDLQKVEGERLPREQLLVHELLTAKLSMVFKLAAIVPEAEISSSVGPAAMGAGLLIRVFASETAALSWLLEDKPT